MSLIETGNKKRVVKVNNLLTSARKFIDTFEATLLLAYVLSWTRTEILTREHELVDQISIIRFFELVSRRFLGEPIAYLLGRKEFFGLQLKINADVLIPRPETEMLVDLALADLIKKQELVNYPKVLELGTGSGAIAIAIAVNNPNACIVATDLSIIALKIAIENAQTHIPSLRKGGPIIFQNGVWYSALNNLISSFNEEISPLKFHLIVSNPPYISAKDPHLKEGDLRYEPRISLTDESDGLRSFIAIISNAMNHLYKNGTIWLEHGYDQAKTIRALLKKHGFQGVRSIRDLSGIERISGGTKP